MIISGGVNIYPREAEDVLVVHYAVEDVAVIGTPDEVMGEQVTAFVQLRDGEVGERRARRRADRVLPRRSCRTSSARARSASSTSLPRLPNGKLLKRMLTAHS